VTNRDFYKLMGYYLYCVQRDLAGTDADLRRAALRNAKLASDALDAFAELHGWWGVTKRTLLAEVDARCVVSEKVLDSAPLQEDTAVQRMVNDARKQAR
jgi:hypothetical protein